MAQKISEDLRKKFSELTKMKYADQAKWFLNGFWGEGMDKEAETIWKYANKFIEIDEKRKKEGNELDEFQAHKFLESLGETLTVVEMRERLRQIDLDFNKRVALIEYLTVRYKKNVQEVVDAPQGDPEEAKRAAAQLEAVQKALQEVQNQLEQQTKALNEQKKAEEAVKKAEAEVRSAVEELKKQEDAYNTQLKTLEAKANDSNAGAVSRNKAVAELAQLKQEDPTPLRRAKLTQEAALKKVEKERKAAEAASAALEEQTRKVEAAYRDTEQKVKEAEEMLEKAKRSGNAQGAVWWIGRELKEAQKYLPQRKQQM